MHAAAGTRTVPPIAPSFEAILDGLPHPVMLIDQDANILWSNSAGEQAFGISLLGHAIRDVFPQFSTSLATVVDTFRVPLQTSSGELYQTSVSRVGFDHFVLSLELDGQTQAPGLNDVDELTGMAKDISPVVPWVAVTSANFFKQINRETMVPETLYRLVYYSRNHIHGDEASFVDNVEQILERSRYNNFRDEITGALLFNSGCFAQVLEGPLDKIEAAFERIQQDERHGEVSLLALDPISDRSFPNWAMGYVGSSIEQETRYSAIGQDSGFNPARLSGDQVHSLLRDLALEEEAAAA